MSLFLNCLRKALDAGQINERAYNEAKAFYEAETAGLAPELGGASAEAVAALQLVNRMREAAKTRQRAAAADGLALDRAQGAMATHGRGKAAGLMAIMSPDTWGDKGFAGARFTHIEGLEETIKSRLYAKFTAGLEQMRTGFAGLGRAAGDARAFVRELFGNDTGDAATKAAVAQWRAMKDYAVERAQAAGKQFSALEDWRMPQFWTAARVRAVSEAEWVQRLTDKFMAGRLDVLDASGNRATPENLGDILRKARENIITGGGRFTNSGAREGGVFRREMRHFHFKDADTYLELMGEFGPGQGGLWEMLRNHVDGMAREIALTEALGPSYRANFRQLLADARKADLLGEAVDAPKRPFMERLLNIFGMNGWEAAERMFAVVTGDVNVPKTEGVSSFFAGARAFGVATKLGGAVVSAVFGDSATTRLAASVNGLDTTRVLARTMEIIMADDATKRADAAHLGIVAHAMMDTALGVKRYHDDIAGPRMMQQLANTVVRVSGLQAWTEALKRGFMLEFLGYAGRQTERAFADLDEPFRNFLARYGFDAAEWEAIRAGPKLTSQGAVFLDPEKAADQRLMERFLTAISDERRFAVLEPDARVRQITTHGAQAGTLPGELWRSAFAFKSFTMSMMVTHAMRAAMGGAGVSRAGYLAHFAFLTTMAGAATIVAKDILNGKDPRQATTNGWPSPGFWAEAVFQGGGLGIFGDFVRSTMQENRYGQALLPTLGGPLAGSVTRVAQLLQGGPSADELARLARADVPGSNLWFASLVYNRLFIDAIYENLDSEYRSRFARMERLAKERYGQAFWWGPGQDLPTRAPDLANPFQ